MLLDETTFTRKIGQTYRWVQANTRWYVDCGATALTCLSQHANQDILQKAARSAKGKIRDHRQPCLLVSPRRNGTLVSSRPS